MLTLFNWLTEALNGEPWLAVVAAAAWGMASLLLSPCHLSSIPLIVGFVASRNEEGRRSAWGYALLFACGILVSIAAIGGITVAMGRMMGDIGVWPNYLVAAILAVVGLQLMGLVPLDWGGGLRLPQWKGLWAAGLLGLVFGAAVGPCTFAYLAPVLALVFKVAAEHPLYAAVLLLAYGVGHCLLIVLAGVSTGRVQKVLNWNGESKAAVFLKRFCGLLVLVGAGWLVYSA